MRRQDIRLRQLARQGDNLASLKLAEIYLRGQFGIARSVPVGLSYVEPAIVDYPDECASLIAAYLQLQEIVSHGKIELLERAARSDTTAQAKLAAWMICVGDDQRATELLSRAKSSAPLLQAWLRDKSEGRRERSLASIRKLFPMNVPEVAAVGARFALNRNEINHGLEMLSIACRHDRSENLNEAVVQAIQQAESLELPIATTWVSTIERSLHKASQRGNPLATYLLGRACCGISTETVEWKSLVRTKNIRKGLAFLLKAGDCGVVYAWLHLYRVSSDYRCSAANSQLARFCLEKAAAADVPEAQRRLGAMVMCEAETLSDVEQSLSLLHRAGEHGDVRATYLLRSFLLPVKGSTDTALRMAAEVQRVDPRLAIRLRLARFFGLTKREALTVDPVTGERPWGLVVGPNSFLTMARLAAPRAIPAVGEDALACLRQSAQSFRASKRLELEGDLRHRAANQRRVFSQLGMEEEFFFSEATSAQRDVLRVGSKWAHRWKPEIQMALAD